MTELNIAQALRGAARMLEAISPAPRFDAELLMAHALDESRSDMLLRHMTDPVPDAFAALLERRRAHEPMAYILGNEEFFGLPLKVSADVLIPRADSEVVVEQAIASRPGARAVLDCGTGTGALLLAVLSQLEDAHGTGVDRSPQALGIARHNVEALGFADRVTLALADWERPGWSDALGGPFDLVLANPPYVETTAQLEPSVRRYEPEGALFAGPEGLDAYRVLIPQIPGLLCAGGVAIVEIGASQASAVSHLAEQAGLTATLFYDGAQRPRALRLIDCG